MSENRTLAEREAGKGKNGKPSRLRESPGSYERAMCTNVYEFVRMFATVLPHVFHQCTCQGHHGLYVLIMYMAPCVNRMYFM